MRRIDPKLPFHGTTIEVRVGSEAAVHIGPAALAAFSTNVDSEADFAKLYRAEHLRR